MATYSHSFYCFLDKGEKKNLVTEKLFYIFTCIFLSVSNHFCEVATYKRKTETIGDCKQKLEARKGKKKMTSKLTNNMCILRKKKLSFVKNKTKKTTKKNHKTRKERKKKKMKAHKEFQFGNYDLNDQKKLKMITIPLFS